FGGIAEPPLLEAVPSPQPFGYRNTGEFHVRAGQLGFHREGSHQLVDVQQCPLMDESINRALTPLRRRLAHPPQALESVQLRAGEDAPQVTLYVQDDPRAYKILAAELAAAIGD